MVTIAPKDTRGEAWGEALGTALGGVATNYMQHADEMALQNAIHGLAPNASPREIIDALTNVKTHSNKPKQTAIKNLIGAEEFEETRRSHKANEDIDVEKNRIAGLKVRGQGDQEALKQSYLAAGHPEYEADLLVNPDVTPATKQEISRSHGELVKRGIRQPLVPQSEAQQVTPEDQNNEAGVIEEVAAAPIANQEEQAIVESEPAEIPVKEEWPDLPPPPRTTPGEQEKWRASNQRENNKLLKTMTDKAHGRRDAVARLNHAQNLNDSKKLPSGLGRLVINPATGDPYDIAVLGGLVNKETQNFVKTINDFLVNAKDYFGSRVTNFDIVAFKERLPRLLNTDDGRRLIIEQMKLMEELQNINDEEVRNGLKHYGRNASYSDIQNIADEHTTEKEALVLDKINNLVEASDYLDMMNENPKYKNTKLMRDPEGKFKAVKQNQVGTALQKGYEAW